MNEPPMTRPFGVMTFNIRHDVSYRRQRAQDRWSYRRDAVMSVLAADPEPLIALQEVCTSQLADVRAALPDRYLNLGLGADGGPDGEHSAILVDPERFEVLDSGHLALSDTPDVSGSLGWGNSTPRVVTHANLVDRVDGRSYLALATHLDTWSFRARRRSAESLRAFVIAHDLPTILMADFNASLNRPASVRPLFYGGLLHDTWRRADHRTTKSVGTFGAYLPPHRWRSRIDGIIVTEDIDCVEIGIDMQRPGGVWPSDHLPIRATLRAAAGPRAPSSGVAAAAPDISPTPDTADTTAPRTPQFCSPPVPSPNV